jgi:hypothetical protein
MAYMASPIEQRNADLKQLILLFKQASFSIAEPIYSDPSTGYYLAVFKSERLKIKFSHDRSDLFVWVNAVATPETHEWCEIRYIALLLLEDHKIDQDPSASFSNVSGIASFFIREHGHIAELFSSHNGIKLSARVRRIEEEERSAGLRALGIKYKNPY